MKLIYAQSSLGAQMLYINIETTDLRLTSGLVTTAGGWESYLKDRKEQEVLNCRQIITKEPVSGIIDDRSI